MGISDIQILQIGKDNQMRLIVDVPEDIVDTLKCIETLSMEQEADLIDAVYEALNEEICEDAISRKDMALNIASFYNKATEKKKTLDFLCKCVEGLPSVQPQQRWIPVSERLPDEDDVYLVTMNVLGRHIRDINRFRIDERWESYGNNEDNEVIAWMPLPEPYKAESEPQESEKYCDRNICISNEYNGIGCNECEVTKSREPKTGHWIKDTYQSAHCSNCGQIQRTNGQDTTKNCNIHYALYPYCPKCGAKMQNNER